MKYQHAAVAGTFDRLHAGQKKLLEEAFTNSATVSVGIAQGPLLKNKILRFRILDSRIRKKELRDYLSSRKLLARACFFPLKDIYGIARTDKTLQALYVTSDSYKNAVKVNDLRKKRGLSLLDIVRVPLVKGPDGKVISSERIRRGEIDRDGRPYAEFFEKKGVWKLSEELRVRLRIPLGKVIGKADEYRATTSDVIAKIRTLKPSMVIAVGDIIAWQLRKVGRTADIEIIDLRSKRESIKLPGLVKKNARQVANEPGTISYKFVEKYEKAIDSFLHDDKKSQILIKGEEDLTALPAILRAPLGGVVLYGHFERGVVLVEVTEEKKEEIKRIIDKF